MDFFVFIRILVGGCLNNINFIMNKSSATKKIIIVLSTTLLVFAALTGLFNYYLDMTDLLFSVLCFAVYSNKERQPECKQACKNFSTTAACLGKKARITKAKRIAKEEKEALKVEDKDKDMLLIEEHL